MSLQAQCLKMAIFQAAINPFSTVAKLRSGLPGALACCYPSSTERETCGMTTIYGIKNCDTMKKARTWLESQGVAHDFHDYKAKGIDASTLDGWIGKVGWEVLLNKAGTTFKKLDDDKKEGLDAQKAKTLMLEQPSMIKRPVLDVDGALVVGFKPETYQQTFKG